MEYNTFKRVLLAFAETKDDLVISKGNLLFQYREEVIDAQVVEDAEGLWVTEKGEKFRARSWLLLRIARLPLLADRIINYIQPPKAYIATPGSVQEELADRNQDSLIDTPDAGAQILELARTRIPGASSVIYLTADAGEGKTTILHHIARQQAEAYKRKESDFIFLPIEMGGKPFLRFDDVITGTLMNKLRFQILFYDAFVEMVKLGAIIPAFDGFEEMFVQTQGGDALTAVGNLMSVLQSQGSVVISARKAYFDYQDARIQARLYDSIGTYSVAFSRVALKRWQKPQFLSYCSAVGVTNGDSIYTRVLDEVGDDQHPILTRAVLVRRLLEVASDSARFDALLNKLNTAANNYFFVFVQTLVEREAYEKWIDIKSDPAQPLLTVEEHFELLSLLTQEMWLASTDALKAEILDFVSELFCDSRKKTPSTRYQVAERLKQHALLVADNGGLLYSFDHEEFKNFFLGYAVFTMLSKAGIPHRSDLVALLRKGALPQQAVDTAGVLIRTLATNRREMIDALLESALLDGNTSFTHENAVELILLMLQEIDADGIELKNLTMPSDSLVKAVWKNVRFTGCYFGSSRLEGANLDDVQFINCHFDRIDCVDVFSVKNVVLDNCRCASVVPKGKDIPVFNPETIPLLLKQYGFALNDGVVSSVPETQVQDVIDPEFQSLQKLLRLFYRATQINEKVLLMKFGAAGKQFINQHLDDLIKHGVLTTVPWTGSDVQRRFKLDASMSRINSALEKAEGQFSKFIADFTKMKE